MASILDFLSPLVGATAESVQGYDTGRMERGEREQAKLLQEVARMRQAKIDDLNARNIESQITNRERPSFGVVTDKNRLFNRDTGEVTEPQGVTQGTPQRPTTPVRGTPEYEAMLTREADARRDPNATVQNDQSRFQREQSLASQFRMEKAVVDAGGIASAVSTIRGALANPTPQGDLAAIYALVKLYDPGSVVREGEISLTQSASSLPQRVRLIYDQYRTGKKLLPEQRAAIAEIANSIVDERQAAVNPVLQRYGDRARAWGVDSAAVAPNPLEGARVGTGSPFTTSTGRTVVVPSLPGRVP